MELKPVSLLSSEVIQPADTRSAGDFDRLKYELTGFDRMMRYAPYQKRILFYNTPVEQEYDEIVRSLKDSLARALVTFHPLAGRLTSGDGVSTPILELDCTQELGVRFTEAKTDTTLDELVQESNFQPCEFSDSLCSLGSPPEPKFPWTREHPLVFVQVTRFGCGRLSVGVGFSHQVMDGPSAWNFINSWAELTRTDHLNDNRIPKQFYTFKEPQLSKEELIEAGKAIGYTATEKSSSFVLLQESKVELKTKLLKLSKAFTEDLRSQAGATKDGRRVSSYVAICAFFWRKITAARELTGPSGFLVLVSTRGKVSSVPESYFGNAISFLRVSADARELVTSPLSYAAGLLHEAIVNFDSVKAEGCISFASWVIENNLSLGDKPFTMVVSSPRHPVYECDFGFGRPIGSTFGANDLHEGKLYLFPSAQGDGVDATVVLQQAAIDRLLQDTSLSEIL